MLTRAGALTLLVSVASGVAAVLFGVPELFLAALVSGVLTLAAAGVTSIRPPLWVTAPPAARRVQCGEPVVVRLRVGNGARRRSVRAVTIRDEAATEPGAVLSLREIASGAVAEASYQLPTERRGWHSIGPLWLEVTDPFGLARFRHHAVAAGRVLVWPRAEPLEALPDRIDASVERRWEARVSGGAATDFHSLRRYEPGDNPRRIHWPASARYQELLVRRFEAFQHPETVIYLETDAATATESTFERMVCVAAGLARVAAAGGFGTIRLFSRAGLVATSVGSPTDVLDALALVEQSAPGHSPLPVLPEAQQPAGLLAVLGDVSADRPLVLPTAPRRRIVVQFWERHEPLRHPEVVAVGPGDSAAERWQAYVRAVAARSRAGRAGLAGATLR